MSNILIIGGTGNISWNLACAALALGFNVYTFNRGKNSPYRRALPADIRQICGDIHDIERAKTKLAGINFDVVVDFVCYTPEHAYTAINLFLNTAQQYIFISTTAVYAQSGRLLPYRESDIQKKPTWKYAENKAACEQIFKEAYASQAFPVTIVRPGHTYDTVLPVAVGPADWTVPSRILAGKPIVIHGDGTTLWTLTHADDFCSALAGLLGREDAIGEDFHITSDEWLTWNEITEAMVDLLGVTSVKYIHIPSMAISRIHEYYGAGIIGHKMRCDIYNNSKIKRYVPKWKAKIDLKTGLAKSFEWYLKNPTAKQTQQEFDSFLDQLALLGESMNYYKKDDN